nr:MFS transporter [Lacticaseibacillus paracasei]
MRAPITTPPLILKPLATTLNIPLGSLGILTTLPILMFVVFSSFSSITAKNLGLKQATLMAIGLTLLGSLLRLIVTMPTIIIGTILIGIGIAHLNVFMPSLVGTFFPEKVGLYTTIYTFSMFFGNAIFNLLTAPASHFFGWHSILVILALPPFLSFVGWAIISRTLPKVNEDTSSRKTHTVKSMWRNPNAWLLLVMFGIQSVLSYTYSAWMPSLMSYHNLSANAVGSLTSVFAIIGLLIALCLPQLLIQLSSKQICYLIAIVNLLGLIAGGMLFFQNTSSILFWLIQSVLIGVIVGFFFVNIMTMFVTKTRTPVETISISSMAQTGGYFMGGIAPLIYGVAFSKNPTGNIQVVVELCLVLVMLFTSLKIAKIKYI